MSILKKSAVFAMLAASALSTATVQAGPFVFGKEPVARHNRAVAARRAQAGVRGYTYNAPVRYYSTQPMVMMSQPTVVKSRVTPVAGQRTANASSQVIQAR